jgi:hypothetical protein
MREAMFLATVVGMTVLLTGMLCRCEFGTLDMEWCPTKSSANKSTCWQIKSIKRWLRRDKRWLVEQNDTCGNFIPWLKKLNFEAVSPGRDVIVAQAIPYVLASCKVTTHTIETFAPYIDALKLYDVIANNDSIENEVVSHIAALQEATQETYDELLFGRAGALF